MQYMYIIEYIEYMMQIVNQCFILLYDFVMVDEQDFQWNVGKMSIVSVDGIVL